MTESHQICPAERNVTLSCLFCGVFHSAVGAMGPAANGTPGKWGEEATLRFSEAGSGPVCNCYLKDVLPTPWIPAHLLVESSPLAETDDESGLWEKQEVPYEVKVLQAKEIALLRGQSCISPQR